MAADRRILSTMRARLKIALVVALCLAIFVVFLTHKPACSSSSRLHNKPVAKFKALSADTYSKTGIEAVAAIALANPVIVPVRAEAQLSRGDGVVTPDSTGPQVLSCCFLC